uniref:Uncharacterized protein n=1 Tax=Sphaerodactylus townsendi TaxID=933632 RepID=A0ACB8GFU0_9SAUR
MKHVSIAQMSERLDGSDGNPITKCSFSKEMDDRSRECDQQGVLESVQKVPSMTEEPNCSREIASNQGFRYFPPDVLARSSSRRREGPRLICFRLQNCEVDFRRPLAPLIDLYFHQQMEKIIKKKERSSGTHFMPLDVIDLLTLNTC